MDISKTISHLDISNCFINADKTTLILSLKNGQYYTLNINGDINTSEELKIINYANRFFIIKAHQNNSPLEGCLPSKCVLTEDLPSVNIKPRYLLNVFIHILEKIYPDVNSHIFRRDTLLFKDIPATPVRIQEILSNFFEGGISKYISKLDTLQNGDFSLVSFFQIFGNHVKVLQEKISQKYQNIQNSSKLKKSINLHGGLPNHQEFNSFLNLEENSNSNLYTQYIHDCSNLFENEVVQYKNIIKEQLIYRNKNSALARVIEILQNSGNNIYFNMDISFSLIFSALGEIFTFLFTDVLPKKSMIHAVMGTLYYTIFLHELGLLERFSQYVHTPIILRIIYCCFKENEQECNLQLEENFKNEFPGLYNKIKHYNNNNLIDENIGELAKNNLANNLDFIINVAEKVDLNNENLVQVLFYILNKYRNKTYEYYLILITCAYMKGNLLEVTNNKINRRANAKDFISPLHKVITCFYIYVNIPEVKQEIFNNITNVHKVIEGFSHLYSVELKSALDELLKIVAKQQAR